MHFLQIIDNRKEKNVIREKCIASVKRFLTDNDKHIIKEVNYSNDIPAMINETDKIRFSYAKQYDDLFYIDTDCFLCALPTEEQLKRKKIIIGETITNNGPMIDIFLFYVNGQKEFFLKNYEEFTKKHDLYSLSSEQLHLFSGKTIPYDTLSYCHYSLTSLEININKHYNLLSNRLMESEKEVNAYRTAIQGMVQTVELYNKLRENQGNKNG